MGPLTGYAYDYEILPAPVQQIPQRIDIPDEAVYFPTYSYAPYQPNYGSFQPLIVPDNFWQDDKRRPAVAFDPFTSTSRPAADYPVSRRSDTTSRPIDDPGAATVMSPTDPATGLPISRSNMPVFILLGAALAVYLLKKKRRK